VRVGLVCPYSWDVPGGVQEHIRDLAETLMDLGHQVSVITPADDDTVLPSYAVSAGRAVPVPYNGSVGRVAFGCLSASRVRRWLKEGQFDVLHVHEPAAPSLSLLAAWSATGPIVAFVGLTLMLFLPSLFAWSISALTPPRTAAGSAPSPM